MREKIDTEMFKTSKGIYGGKDTAGVGVTEYYGTSANRVAVEKESLAKSVPHETGTSYFVRYDGSRLFNPLTHNGAHLTSFDSARGESKFPLRKVTKEKFDGYLEFLRTKNPARLSILERL